jgi:hypothetical protein
MSNSKSSLRATRVALVQTTLRARRTAEKLAAHQHATVHAQQQAYMLAVQQLATAYGMPVPNTMSVRSVNNVQKHAPSAVQGACKRVHALADQYKTRGATLAACKAEGINPATAATQYAKWHKSQPVVAA